MYGQENQQPEEHSPNCDFSKVTSLKVTWKYHLQQTRCIPNQMHTKKYFTYVYIGQEPSQSKAFTDRPIPAHYPKR